MSTTGVEPARADAHYPLKVARLPIPPRGHFFLGVAPLCLKWLAISSSLTCYTIEMKQDYSYGVIPVREIADSYELLVIHQISYTGDRFWIFPKGHAEIGESPAEAALRELEEETGLQDVSLNTDQPFTLSYSFKHEGENIQKTVTYFIGEVGDPATHISDPSEVAALAWVPLAEVEEKVTHQDTKELVRKVVAFLGKKVW